MRSIRNKEDGCIIYKNYMLLPGDEITLSIVDRGVREYKVDAVVEATDHGTIVASNIKVGRIKSKSGSMSSRQIGLMSFNFRNGSISTRYGDIDIININEDYKLKEEAIIRKSLIHSQKRNRKGICEAISSVIVTDKEVLKLIDTSKRHFIKLEDHPDCCGALIAYNFDISDKKLRYLKDNNQINEIKDILVSTRRNVIAHIAGYQHQAIELVTLLGFKRIHKFLNTNSGNKINIFSLEIDKGEDD